MFSNNHFILLGICGAAIVLASLLAKKMNWNLKWVLLVCCFITILCETTKILNNLSIDDYGARFSVWALPFHLCSMQIFALWFCYLTKNDRRREIMFCLMVPTIIIGAAMALLLPTIGTDLTNPEVWTSFIFHSMLMFFAVYLLLTKRVKITTRVYFRNLAFLAAILIVVGFWVNGMFGTNFLYVMHPPMTGLPLLNLDNGYYIYLISYLCLAVLLFTICHFVFIISSLIRSNLHRSNK
ncbi:MAG: YwaF family protein [Christensenellaceae bacterium]|jgi:hypothetical integral membrane protein (TIGR02206 family)|nr:YwaF family protein [Christensenellaceae bacterium]